MQAQHLSKELAILNYIEENSQATQRDLSAFTGVSLGTVNLVLKRMVKVGWLKIERMQPNSVKYFLTPSGIANKIERTYAYLVRTYNEIERLQKRIIAIANALAKREKLAQIFFYGQENELDEMIDNLISNESFIVPAKFYHTLEELKADPHYHKETAVLLISKESQTPQSKEAVQWINLMGMLRV